MADSEGGDDDAAIPPDCAVDVLLVLHPTLFGSSTTCDVVDYACRSATFEAFDAELAAGGVDSYHLGAVYAIGGHAWFGEERGCWSYAGMTSGAVVRLTDPHFTCSGLSSPPSPWADGPGGTAARASLCLGRFGIPGEGALAGACYPVAEGFKAVANALSPTMRDGPNTGMFRETARMVVAFVAPKDDCSVDDPAAYASFPDWPSSCGVATAWESWLSNVDDFASDLQRARGERVAVAVWGGPDGIPAEVVEPDGARHPEYLCQIGEGVGVPVAPRFHRLLRAMEDRALFSNACETPFSEFVDLLADFIVAQLPAECRGGSGG
jgi:hypothetical protein